MNEANEDEGMDEARMCELLQLGLEEVAEDEGLERVRVRTFADAALLTTDKGIVVRIGAAEFQISVIRSR